MRISRSLVLFLNLGLLFGCSNSDSGASDELCENENCDDSGEIETDTDIPDTEIDSGEPEDDPDTDIPDSDTDIPDSDTNLPDIDTDIPDDPDTNLPDIDTDIPDDPDTNLPDIDTDIPDSDTDIPDVDTDIPDPDTGPITCIDNWDHSTNEILLAALSAHHSATHIHLIDYRDAREAMFGDIDNVDGWVDCVYTDFRGEFDSPPNGGTPMNTEHTWPQSLGAGDEPKRSDIHHLFPSESRINGTRGSYPFCDTTGEGILLGTDANGDTCFEPPDDHKGDVARALFHFSAVYDYPIDEEYEVVLRNWHQLYPPDADEIARNIAIEQYQGSRNAFVDCPELVEIVTDF